MAYGAAAVAEADAEGREEDGAHDLQAPAAARAQPHRVRSPLSPVGLLAVAGLGGGGGSWTNDACATLFFCGGDRSDGCSSSSSSPKLKIIGCFTGVRHW